MRSITRRATMLRFSLLVLGLTAPINCILPEIVNADIIQTFENHLEQGHPSLDNRFVSVEDSQHREDSFHRREDDSAEFNLHPTNPPSRYDETTSGNLINANHSVNTVDQADTETDNTTVETEALLSRDKDNSIDHECVTDEDCEKGRYCLYETARSRCLPCKAIDVPCTKDEECCAGQLCVWGQCSPNATKGEAGSICHYQNDCNPDLCCAFHKALLFPVCSAKPIERERCFGPSNHLMELLSWDVDGKGPREHCPCAGDLQCQPLGRGSMCLKGQNSSEEDLTDTLYSEIDYIV